MNEVVTTTARLLVQQCINCHITFAVPAEFDARRHEDRQSFYCPSGHAQSYTGPTEAERLRKEIAQRDVALANRAAECARGREQREVLERQLSASKGQITKLRKRLGAAS